MFNSWQRNFERKQTHQPDEDWVPIDLYGDACVSLDLTFFRSASVSERLVITQAERPRSGDRKMRFRFDREFATSLTNSPDHLTPISLLPLAQKLYYYLLSSSTGHDVREEGERYKIWPVEVLVQVPELVTQSTNIRGELTEVFCRRMPPTSGVLYPGVQPSIVCGSMTIDQSMQFEFKCMVYDLGRQRCRT